MSINENPFKGGMIIHLWDTGRSDRADLKPAGLPNDRRSEEVRKQMTESCKLCQVCTRGGNGMGKDTTCGGVAGDRAELQSNTEMTSGEWAEALKRAGALCAGFIELAERRNEQITEQPQKKTKKKGFFKRLHIGK
jgi:hypothetical protein